MDCFSTFQPFFFLKKNKRCFIWFRFMDQLALHVRFLNASQEPFVGQEHSPTETSRPLSTGPDPCGRLQSFGAARPLLRLSLGLGRRGARPHIHPAVTVGGPCWHSVCDGLHVFLVLGQYFRIVVIMRLRILATIALTRCSKLYELPVMAITRCTSPRSHIGTSSVPSPTTMGADHPSRGPHFAQSSLGSPQCVAWQLQCARFCFTQPMVFVFVSLLLLPCREVALCACSSRVLGPPCL